MRGLIRIGHNSWRGYLVVNGRERKPVIKAFSQRQAEQIFCKVKSDAIEGKYFDKPVSGPKVKFNDFVKEVLDTCSKTKEIKESTIESYYKKLDIIGPYFEHKTIAEISIEMIEKFKIVLLKNRIGIHDNTDFIFCFSYANIHTPAFIEFFCIV